MSGKALIPIEYRPSKYHSMLVEQEKKQLKTQHDIKITNIKHTNEIERLQEQLKTQQQFCELRIQVEKREAENRIKYENEINKQKIEVQRQKLEKQYALKEQKSDSDRKLMEQNYMLMREIDDLKRQLQYEKDVSQMRSFYEKQALDHRQSQLDYREGQLFRKENYYQRVADAKIQDTIVNATDHGSYARDQAETGMFDFDNFTTNNAKDIFS